MAKRKTLRSVADSFAASFIGPLNYAGDDLAITHLARAAWECGKNTLHIDLLTGRIEPPELVTPQMLQSIQWYIKLFPDMVARSSSDMTFVKEATLTIKLEPKVTLIGPIAGRVASPYLCTVRIVDDRGKSYVRAKLGSTVAQPRQTTLLCRIKRFFEGR